MGLIFKVYVLRDSHMVLVTYDYYTEGMQYQRGVQVSTNTYQRRKISTFHPLCLLMFSFLHRFMLHTSLHIALSSTTSIPILQLSPSHFSSTFH